MGFGLSAAISNPVNYRTFFNPTSIAGMTAWFDPNSGVTTSSGHVTQWVDKINSYTFTNNGTGATVATGINGYHTINFDASGTYLAGSPAVPISDLVNAAHYSCFIVFRYTGSTAHSTGDADAGIITPGGAGYWNKTVSTTTINNNHFDGAQKTDSITITTSTNYYCAMIYDGTNLRTSVNNAALSAGTAAGSISNTTFDLIIGENASVTAGMQGSLGDMIFWNVALTQAQINNLNNWAAQRYSIGV